MIFNCAICERKWTFSIFSLIILFIIHLIFYKVDIEAFPNSVGLLITALAIVFIPSAPIKLKTWKHKFFIIIFSFILASINWILVSYDSFYDGVSFNIRNEANILYESTVNILQRDITEKEKKVLLNDIYSKSFAEISLKKNEKEFIFIESKRSKDEYQVETIIDWSHIYTKEGVFSFKYSYANKPKLEIGLPRAWTFSVIPDFIPQGKFDNLKYLKGNLFDRSITFWLSFVILYYLLLSVIFQLEERNKAREEKIKAIEEKNIAIEEKIKAIERIKIVEENISKIHKHVFGQIMRDIQDATTTQAKTVLQELLTNWENKKHFTDDYENLYQQLDKTAHSIKHDFVSKWTDGNEFYDHYNKDIKKYIKEIIDDLNDIPKLLDIRIQKISVSEILNKLNEINYINGSQRKEPGVNFNYVVANTDLISSDKYCELNLERIKSIIYNLIKNSVSAINNKKRELKRIDRTLYKNYEGKIMLKVDVVEHNGKKYLYFSCEDNGGGFPEPNKIYKELVDSSRLDLDGKHRKGQGTSYISFFVQLYGGRIEASNYNVQEGVIGAKTEIYFPMIS